VSYAQGSGDGTEDVDAGGETRGGDDGPDVSFALSGPHGAVAIGDLALDNGGAKVPLAGIIGGFDLAGPVRKGKELLPGAGEPVAQLHRQVARCRRGDDVVDGSLQRASPAAIVDGASRLMASASPNALFSHSLSRIGRKSSLF